MKTVSQKSCLLHGLLGKTCHHVYVTRTYCLNKHKVFTIPMAFSFAILVKFNTFSSVFKKRYRLVGCHIWKKSFSAECQCFPCKQKKHSWYSEHAMWCSYWPQPSKRQIKCQSGVESSQMQLLNCISLLVFHMHLQFHASSSNASMLPFQQREYPWTKGVDVWQRAQAYRTCQIPIRHFKVEKCRFIQIKRLMTATYFFHILNQYSYWW